MPLFTYTCANCRKTSELLVRASSDNPACPHCGKQTLAKQASAINPKAGESRAAGGLPPSCESCCSRGSCPNL